MLSWIAEKVTDTAKWVFGIHEIDLTADQESVIEPGAGKSIISGSLDELDPKITPERFFAEVEASQRWPLDPITEYVLKSCDVEDHSPDEFTVKVTLDGKKLDTWGRGRGDGCDRVKTWKKVTIDRKALKLTTSDYVHEAAYGEWVDKCDDKTVQSTFNIGMIKDPNRFEFWLMKDGERNASQELAGFMCNWFDPIIKNIKAEMNAKVKVAVAPSPTNANVSSVLSDPMDEFIDYDTYFEAMIVKTKQFLEKIPNTVVEDVSANEFVANTTVKDGDGNDVVQPKKVTYNQESGEMTIAFLSVDAKTSHSVYRVLHKTPLRMEAWQITDTGERTATASFVKSVSQEINETIG